MMLLRRNFIVGCLTLLGTFFVLGFNAPAIAQTVASGGWSKQEQRISGGWKIVQRDGGYVLQLSDSFQTRNAPDLKLFLSRSAPGQITGRNATQGSVFIGKLKASSGGQSYQLPRGINPKDFNALVLHCEAYSKLWGAGHL